MINIPCAFHFDTNRTDNIRTLTGMLYSATKAFNEERRPSYPRSYNFIIGRLRRFDLPKNS